MISECAPRTLLRRAGIALALLLGALLLAGCLPRGRPVILVNDTDETVVAQALTVKTVKAQTFPPGTRQTVYPLRASAVGYRLSDSQGELGCLTISRPAAFELDETLLFSQATPRCPTVPLAGVVHATTAISRGFVWLQFLGYVLGPICAGVWIVMWARRTPGRSVPLAVAELLGLCCLSAVILAALLHWGVPQP